MSAAVKVQCWSCHGLVDEVSGVRMDHDDPRTDARCEGSGLPSAVRVEDLKLSDVVVLGGLEYRVATLPRPSGRLVSVLVEGLNLGYSLDTHKLPPGTGVRLVRRLASAGGAS